MNNSGLRGVLAAFIVACSAVSTPAAAQVSTNRVAAETDWSVFVEGTGNARECWAVSVPKNTVNTRGGKPVDVRRGQILLFLTYRPGKPGEVSFAGGYPFANGSTVKLEIGGKDFDLFTKGENAWAGSAEDDRAIIAAMKAGADAKLTARSTRGTQTEDTFSLLGFTAASEEAETRCK
ncbi:invasion associated locus B family protein [Phaeovulum vinaykumarii]|uniref:Invasion associated locus B (IalB) protein n=1 Tax=Phaeovulum vinaykumarii TaxID=407234 RepID=A0A1N7L009_9RHOB|nr:invasion associated locus B family protein [Phaeovulum vinaykumarii]SIS66990.1 hypothetical protein SAMN05421795_102348 [Phaeovulum vinaykumarii]SOC00892.1 hypothetical protein SAMN05878426_102424 [Phaeovulum vinaykumarii]